MPKKLATIKEGEIQQEPKKRAPRAKKQPPSKQETLNFLSEGIKEVKQIIQELKEDQGRLGSIQLKHVPDLIQETLRNLEEDCEKMTEQHKQLQSLPDTELSLAK